MEIFIFAALTEVKNYNPFFVLVILVVTGLSKHAKFLRGFSELPKSFLKKLSNKQFDNNVIFEACENARFMFKF